ncbi:single-stranded DNA-binding protein [Haploplasma axanthum]|uniref:Single-stranded DNA-binding protein n=1 Tax=Haploplasma axanthum TaxID=29552 RepID=A0A449BCS3_HAPAX|nr:single-stranded DNA-binding protein [Haploplasma axanthum]VEU80217.1 single-stranded DNA-binding protein [Haploplasma axanthum]
MINNVVLVGRLTKDPELKVTQSNTPFVNFTVAVNRTFTDQTGERQADFINCIVWRKQAENLARYMRQGSLVGIQGRIQTRTFEGEQGTRYITEVVCDSIQFLETKGSQSDNNTNNNNDVNDEYYETSKKLVAEEDLPF